MKSTVQRICVVATLCGLSIGIATPPAEAQSRPTPTRDRGNQSDPAQQMLDAAMRAKVESILTPDGATLTGAAFSSALTEADSLLAQAVWYVDASNAELFREITRAQRLLRLMVDGRQTSNSALWAMLMEHPQLADTIAFSLQPERDNLQEAMLVLDHLRRQFGGDRLAQYPNLTAAITAVHDTPRTPPGRQPSVAATPAELWAYFTKYEQSMAFGIKNMPVDLLAHVVDTSASIAELEWARGRYGRDQQVGNRYSEIMYDDNAFRTSAPKRIDSEPYTLQNIRRVGGVCTEQAYFAAQVGKSMGVPTIELSAIGSTAGHAWLGYLRVRGRQAAWDFDTGCYEEYKQYVGRFRDPLSGRMTEEGSAAFLSQMVGVNNDALHRAVALHDATAVLASFGPEADSPRVTVKLDGETLVAPVRTPTAQHIAAMLTASLGHAPSERRSWKLASDLAENNRIGASEIETVFTALERLCGRNEIGYFALKAPQLLWAVEDTRAQARLYDRVARAVRIKPGYEANVRFHQGDELARRNMHAQAMDAYLLPTRTRNLDGPWTVDAVDRITKLLRDTGKEAHLADAIGDIFRRVPRPSTEGSHESRRGSVWGQVGERYYRALVLSGRTREAEDLRRQLDTILRRVNVPIR